MALPSPAQAVTELTDAQAASQLSAHGITRTDPMYQAASGNVYTNEGSHWDIVYYTCGC